MGVGIDLSFRSHHRGGRYPEPANHHRLSSRVRIDRQPLRLEGLSNTETPLENVRSDPSRMSAFDGGLN